jgi:Uri superfamily endonuclease
MAISSDIQIQGSNTNGGCYLLSIRLEKTQKLRFGMFNHGQEVCLPQGDFLYIGSARGEQGTSSLGYRLLRHATRSAGAPPQVIRERLHHALIDAGLPGKVPVSKTLHWHIDYLLDQPQAELRAVIAYRSQKADEKRIAAYLARLPETSAPAKGLGASDHAGGTHLLGVNAGSQWLERLPGMLQEYI